MTNDPQSSNADPADVAEQRQDVLPPSEDEDVPGLDPDEMPLEADAADVAEQRIEMPPSADEDVDES